MTKNRPVTDDVIARTERSHATALRFNRERLDQKKRQRAAAYADLHGLPTPERKAKGDVVETIVKGSGKRVQAMDALDYALAKKTITDSAYRAGKEFQEDFRKAGLQGISAIDWQRAQGRSLGDGGAVAKAHAADRVWKVFQTLGGVDSQLGKVAWHVVGVGESIADYCNRESSVASVRQNQMRVSGRMEGVLCVIERSYLGYG